MSRAALAEPEARVGYQIAAAVGERALALTGNANLGLQELAGHQSISVTNRSVHLAPGELRNAIALLDRSA
ncbi:MAG: hypothetical protein ABJA82_18535 [Myxococcales bacterium]